MSYPYFKTDNKHINEAYRMAIATLEANIEPFKDGILENEEPVIIAGLRYWSPWTRDAAINTWNAGGLICPEVALNTLKSVLATCDKGYIIGGEYWDAIIWAIGAWNYYLYTGDKAFLKIAYNATENSLEFFEETEFDADKNLFRGAACYGDGIAAYPDVYVANGKSGIIFFTEFCKELCAEKGVGLPMMALSTNCLYYKAYLVADLMAKELGETEKHRDKAKKMYDAINKHFWCEEKGKYLYLIDPFGNCDHYEALGSSFALLFNVADEEKREKVFKNQHITEHGIPCVWPTFSRYKLDENSFGRHSGTVWPHAQGFWADACAMHGRVDKFDFEFNAQTENAIRSHQFSEIYHPVTGEMYGGLQEDNSVPTNISLWGSLPFQTWSATAYLRNVYLDIVGMKFDTNGIHFSPVGSTLIKNAELRELKYRDAVLNINLSGEGSKILSFKVNGIESDPFIPANLTGVLDIQILLG